MRAGVPAGAAAWRELGSDMLTDLRLDSPGSVQVPVAEHPFTASPEVRRVLIAVAIAAVTRTGDGR